MVGARKEGELGPSRMERRGQKERDEGPKKREGRGQGGMIVGAMEE